MLYSSGTSIGKFPSDGIVVSAPTLFDEGSEVLYGDTKKENDVPVLGFYQRKDPHSGRIVVYGDSNCFDSAHMEKGLPIAFVPIFSYKATVFRSNDTIFIKKTVSPFLNPKPTVLSNLLTIK